MDVAPAGIRVVDRFDGVDICVPPTQSLNVRETVLHGLFWLILGGGVVYGVAALVWVALVLVILFTALFLLRQRAWWLRLNGRTLRFWQNGWQSVPLEEIQDISWTNNQDMVLTLTDRVVHLRSLSPTRAQQSWLSRALTSAASDRRAALGITRSEAPARPPPELEALRGAPPR